jgi:hypothetical protein
MVLNRYLALVAAWHGKYHLVQAGDPENHKLIGPGLYLLNLAGEREPD